MGLMGNLRNRAGLVIFVIGLAIVAFLLGDVIKSGMPFFMAQQNEIGRVNGESIEYQLFNQQVDQTSAMYQQQMGGAETPQIKNFAVQQVWNQFISKELLNSEIAKIGLSLGKKEFNDLVTGPNPSPQIMQTFTNPQTGQFDRNYLTQVINEAKSGNAEITQQWETLLDNIRTQRLNEKYSNLLSNSIYVTALEAQDEYTAKNKLANFKYVLLDYSAVNEKDIKLTDADYQAYYDKNKNAFKNPEETRSIDYVLFDASPTAKDSSTTLAVVQNLKKELIASKDDSLFATVNSDNKYPVAYVKKGQVSPALDSVLFNAAPGTTVGPFLSNGAYEIAKVIDTKFSPDSVGASHILLNPTAEGGVDKALAKADSIKGLISKGDSFSALAVEYSVDQQSKINGGSLGTFSRGQMVQPFEDAAFGGKPGDVVIVNTQHGVHILKIEKQVGNSKIVKAAIVDKIISAGKETTDAVYAKANNFFTGIDKNNFTELAQKQGLKVEKSARTLAMDNTVNGTEVPREFVRWVFEAKNNDVSDKIFETEKHFIVAKLNAVNAKGIQPLSAIKNEIELGVKNFVKARMLKEKMDNALKGAANIDQIAQKLGKAPVNVENIVLANPVIPGLAMENAVVGTVFGLQPNKPSKSIEGSQGVYVVQVSSFVNPKEMIVTEKKAQQKQILAGKQQRAWGSIFKALQDNATIDDNRIRFY